MRASWGASLPDHFALKPPVLASLTKNPPAKIASFFCGPPPTTREAFGPWSIKLPITVGRIEFSPCCRCRIRGHDDRPTQANRFGLTLAPPAL